MLAKHPSARVERQRQVYGKPYYLIRIHDAGERKCGPRHGWSGCGDTPAQAWNDAAERMGMFDAAP